MMKQFRYLLEACVLYVFYYLCRILPVDAASGLGGWLGRTIGPRLAASRKALRHLEQALPELSEEQRRRTVRDMWDNLGRVLAEYPHLETIGRERTTFINKHILEDLCAKGGPAVFIGGHLANWEVSSAALLTQLGHPVDLTYRAVNNPFADALLRRARTLNGKLRAFPKSRESGKHILRTVKEGRFLGILIDQKYNEGVAVPFFGRPAMTNPIFVQLGQKYDCPIVPVCGKRLKGAHFEIHIAEPLSVFSEDGNPLPVEKIIENAHLYLENRIREEPGQWIWLHRRWPSQGWRKRL